MKKTRTYIIISSLMICFVLYYIEQILQVDYITKTFIKVVLFTTVPLFYIKICKKTTFKKAFRYDTLERKDFKIGFILGIMSFLVIIITYFILKDRIDFQEILQDLESRSINATNFIWVALYITLGNSFLEEFFFRGFVFLNLYETKCKSTAYIYSSLLFALYHIAIFKSWFNMWLIALALVGLITIGFIFNFIDTKSKNFINSWIVHILADIGIVLIGVKLFYT